MESGAVLCGNGVVCGLCCMQNQISFCPMRTYQKPLCVRAFKTCVRTVAKHMKIEYSVFINHVSDISLNMTINGMNLKWHMYIF